MSIIITLPTTASQVGLKTTIANISAGTVQINAGGNTLLHLDGAGMQSGDRTLASGAVVTVLYAAPNSWRIWGNGIS